MAALKYHTFVAIYDTQPDGDNVVASRSIEVRDKNTGLYATIYSDSAGASPITQPGAATDFNGVFEFYVAPGLYTITDGVRTETVDVKPHSYTFDTVAAAKAAQYLEVGDTVRTREYSAGNGGGASYKVVGPATGTDDGGSYHDMSNGNQLELIVNGVINGKAFNINGTGDLAKIQTALAFAAGKPVDITGASNLSGTIQNITNANLISNGEKITLSGVLTFDNTNTNLKLENVNFDATSVPNGTSSAVVVSVSGLFESINSGVTNAPRGNMIVSKVNEVKGYGGDFSNSGQENFVSGSVNIGVGLHLYGIVTRGRWYNPIANDCWQIGIFINGNTGEVCNDMVVYGASVANAQDNGVRVQPEDAAYATCVDCGFIDPVVDNSTIDNIRLNGIRSFVQGGYSTNATGWACKSDGGTGIVMRGLTCRGNGSGVGARVVENLDGLYVSEIDSDNPTNTPAIYCVQITSGKTVHNVKFDNNKTDGGSQSDLAIILVNSADGLNLSASNNIYRGDSTTNYREVFGVCPYVTSINNSAEGDCTRAFINASNCTDIDVIGFNGAGAPLWGIEANNGTAAGSYSACSWHNITSVAVGGANAANFAATYTISNLSTDRTYDANATTTAELADVLGTLITDLKNNGILL